MKFKSGYIALLGQPNVGKSTLLNKIIGEPVAIVTPKPQTTRQRIIGILNRSDAQAIFIDTPGFHSIPKALNQFMLNEIETAVHDADLFCFLVDARTQSTQIDDQLWQKLRQKNSIVIVNKADLINREERDALAEKLRDRFDLKELFFISAEKGEGIYELTDILIDRLPEGPQLFPEDSYTNLPVRFLVAEAIREQAMMLMHQEIPFGLAAQVISFEEKPQIVVIKANVIVERPSHKSMVIGRSGQMIKKIGVRAREKIEFLLNNKVFLDLNVKVETDWSKDPSKLADLGYLSQN